jgi:thiol-disulfide isomerase/thioredoxin
MINLKFLLLSFLALILGLVLPVSAADNGSFYSNSQGKGYYQYYTPPPETQQDNETLDDFEDSYARPFVPADEVLYKMPAEEFQKLYTATLNYALTERNLDTYGDYARMIHMVNVRAKEFASLQVLYAQLNPRENENKFQGRSTRLAVNREKKKTLETYKDKYSLIYFYSPYCQFCRQFEPTLRNFIDKYGWEVERLDIYNEPEMGVAFGVTVTPTLKLVTLNEDVLSLSNGVITLAELEDRLYRYIRYLEGLTDNTSFIESM